VSTSSAGLRSAAGPAGPGGLPANDATDAYRPDLARVERIADGRVLYFRPLPQTCARDGPGTRARLRALSSDDDSRAGSPRVYLQPPLVGTCWWPFAGFCWKS